MSEFNPVARFFRHLSNLSDSSYSFESALAKELQNFIQKHNTPATRVLDFGCGAKPLSFVFDDFQGEYRGIDIFPGQKVDIVYDGFDVPLEDEVIDLVFASSVFEHIEHLESSFCEIKRVLKHGGEMIAVVPFMGHCHGTPYDFNRPTRFGWLALCRRVFGAQAQVEVIPVDTRISCLCNLVTSQINIALLDLARGAINLVRKEKAQTKAEEIGIVEERQDTRKLLALYFVLRLNPINFLLGLIAWTFSRIPIKRSFEGEITSGYLIKVKKL